MGTNALVTAAAFLVGDAEVVVQLDIKPVKTAIVRIPWGFWFGEHASLGSIRRRFQCPLVLLVLGEWSLWL